MAALKRISVTNVNYHRLKEVQEMLFGESSKGQIMHSYVDEGIRFQFILPGAPHFDGLCEAALKYAKTLLDRSLPNSNFTSEI